MNWQAVFAYIVGIALPFPGFVGTLGPNVSPAAQKLGDLGWMMSFVASFVVYYVVCLIWPTQNQKKVRQMGLGWEEISHQQLTAEDGTVITNDMEGRPDYALGDKEMGMVGDRQMEGNSEKSL